MDDRHEAFVASMKHEAGVLCIGIQDHTCAPAFNIVLERDEAPGSREAAIAGLSALIAYESHCREMEVRSFYHRAIARYIATPSGPVRVVVVVSMGDPITKSIQRSIRRGIARAWGVTERRTRTWIHARGCEA